MSQSVWKQAPYLLVAIVLAASFYALKKVMQTAEIQTTSPQDLSYEMPRTSNGSRGYSLAGRQVVHTVTGGAMMPAPAQPPVAAKTVANGKPNSAPATAQAKNAAKKTDSKKTAQSNRHKRPQLSVQNHQVSKIKLSDFTKSIREEENNGLGEGSSPNPVTTFQSGETTEDDSSKLSAAQWRSKLFALAGVQLAKMGSQFLAAFQKGEVDETSFFQISGDLLTDSNNERQKLGLSLLKQTPAVKSFSILTIYYLEKAPEAVKGDIYAVLKTYSEAGRFPVLSKVLYSPDARVVQMGQKILSLSVASVKPGGNTGQSLGRDGRSPGSAPVSASQLETFVPALRRLVTSNNTSVAQTAQALLDSILALKPAA